MDDFFFFGLFDMLMLLCIVHPEINLGDLSLVGFSVCRIIWMLVGQR